MKLLCSLSQKRENSGQKLVLMRRGDYFCLFVCFNSFYIFQDREIFTFAPFYMWPNSVKYFSYWINQIGQLRLITLRTSSHHKGKT